MQNENAEPVRPDRVARRPVRPSAARRPGHPAADAAPRRRAPDLLDRPGSDAQRAFLAGIQNKADLLEAGYASGLAAPAPDTVPEAILFTGMGGSGAVGRFIQDAAKDHIAVPMHLVRDYSLPASAGADTHVLGLSYSGDTEETLSVVRAAQERGCPVTAFTTGGGLADLVDGAILQPSGMAPRVALAHVWGSTLGYLSNAGVLPEEVPIKRAAAAVRAVDGSCGPDVPEADNPAKLLARALQDRTPQIYATAPFEAVGEFFAALLNENAKRIAHVVTVPECNHNALTGWGGDALRRRYAAVVIHQRDEPGSMARRLEYMQRRHAEWGVPWYAYPSAPIRSFGDHVVEQAAALQLFDHVSYYAAMLQGVDPAEIKEVKGLKAHLRQGAAGGHAAAPAEQARPAEQIPSAEPVRQDASTLRSA